MFRHNELTHVSQFKPSAQCTVYSRPDYDHLAQFSETCGAGIPRWVLLKLASFGDDAKSIKAFGQEVMAQLCECLVQLGAPSLHFYTLNQVEPSLGVLGALS